MAKTIPTSLPSTTMRSCTRMTLKFKIAGQNKIKKTFIGSRNTIGIAIIAVVRRVYRITFCVFPLRTEPLFSYNTDGVKYGSLRFFPGYSAAISDFFAESYRVINEPKIPTLPNRKMSSVHMPPPDGLSMRPNSNLTGSTSSSTSNLLASWSVAHYTSR